MKLQSKILLSIFLPSFFILTVLGTLFYFDFVGTAHQLSYEYDKAVTVAAKQSIMLAAHDGKIDNEEMVSLQENLSMVKIGKSGYVFLIDRNGVLLIHPEAVGRNISNLVHIQTILKEENGFITYTQQTPPGEGRIKSVYFDTIPNLGWKIVAGTYSDELYGAISLPILTAFITLIVIFVISIFMSVNLTKSIYLPIKKTSDELNLLSYKIDSKKLKDEIREKILNITGNNYAINETLKSIKKSTVITKTKHI